MHQRKLRREHVSEGDRIALREGCYARQHLGHERRRAIDFAERPQYKRKIRHSRDALVLSESERQVVVAAGLEQGERPFQMILGLAILAREPACRSGDATGDAGLGRIGSGLDVVEEVR